VEEHLLNGRVVERLALLKIPSEGKDLAVKTDQPQQWEA
jgi:hypothetical protein